MTIKEAFEYLSSECGIGMKNPFIALRNLVEAFGKVADEIDPAPSGDFVKKSGDTMTGPLTVEGDIDCTGSDMYCSVMHPLMIQFNSPLSETSAIDLIGRPTGVGGVQIEVPYKNGTMALTKDIAAYSTEERVVGTWIDGSKIYEKTFTGLSVATNGTTWVNLVEISNIAQVIDVEMYRIGADDVIIKMPVAETQASNGAVRVCIVNATFNGTVSIARIRYTKTTT